MSALVIARAPRAGECKTRLEPLLGPEGCARLQAVLVARAARWALAAAPQAAFLTYSPDDACDELERLVPAGVDLFPQQHGHLGERLAGASAHVLERAGGPLLIVGADLPALSPQHASAALADLRDGCDVTLGPALDGGYYLIGLREPRPELFAIDESCWGGPDVLRLTLAAALVSGLAVGLLRSERDLDDPADARALRADPTTPPEIRAALA